ncbi:MAG TPA: hypothetical protein VII29_14605 [Terriglobales bacterium]
MEPKKVTVQLQLRYEWKEPNASRLRKPLEDLIAALPPANWVNANVTQAASAAGEFEQQTDFSNVPEWLDVLGEAAKSYNLSLSMGPNSLAVSIAASGLIVGIRGEAERAKEIRVQVDRFAATVGLKAIQMTPPDVALRTSGFRRSGSYRLLEDVTASDWLGAVELFRTWIGETQMFTGTIVMKADPGTTQELRSVEKWKEIVTARWDDLTTVGMFLFRTGRAADLRVQFADRTVNLNLTAEDSQAVQEAFTGFESKLKVAPRVAIASDAEFKGERRRYYTAAPITAEWVEKALMPLLARNPAKRTGFGGTFRVADQEYTVQDFNAWMKEVELRWKDMQAAGCWLTTADSRQSVDVDFEREQVTVELRNRPGGSGPAVTTFVDYESELKLTPAPARPYQYYRFARTYRKLNDWDSGSDQALADAIDKAVVATFGDRRYAFMNGSMTEGEGAEMQTPYSSKDEFLTRLRNGVPYVNGRIYLQGPHGYDLGVQLQRNKKKVVLRSSIPDAELFKKVALPFNKIHDLEEFEAENRNAAGEEQKSPSRIGTWMPLISGVPGFVLAALALLASTLPKQTSTLEIGLPRDASEISGRSCRVEWTVTRKTILHGETWETPRAEVLVTKEGDPDYRDDKRDASSGVKIDFPSDGVYDVTVTAPSVPQRSLRVTAKTPAPAPSPTPTAKTSKKN